MACSGNITRGINSNVDALDFYLIFLSRKKETCDGTPRHLYY